MTTTADIVVFEANLHGGHAVNSGTDFKAQVEKMEPHVVLLEEVTPKAFTRLVSWFQDTYNITPAVGHPYKGKFPHATVVMSKKSRFALLSETNDLVSPFVGGGAKGMLWPNRNLPVQRVHDKVTGRVTVLMTVHTWAAANVNHPKILAGHRHQVDTVAANFKNRTKGRVVLAGGDWNENLDGPLQYANKVMKAAGAVRAAQVVGVKGSTSLKGKSHLDDVFVRNDTYVKVIHYRTVTIAGGSDHLGTVTRLRVELTPKMEHEAAVEARPKVPAVPAAGAAAIKRAKAQAASAEGECLHDVAEAFQFPHIYGSAIAAWNASTGKHPETDPMKIPRGYVIFWSGGSRGFGHIAISLGNGLCLSTDILRTGLFDVVPITRIHEAWGLTLLGYATNFENEDIK